MSQDLSRCLFHGTEGRSLVFYSFIIHYLAPCFILYLYFITDLLLFWVMLTSVWMVHSKPLTIPLTDTAPVSHSSLS